ncbi:MAG TPA: NAD(P)H-hydrate epimerase, partial [Gemmatimonadaceae bacterium]|nr:NAD(P)H-hydrate epimerase [Gemmatimonadaceae bacterium]
MTVRVTTAAQAAARDAAAIAAGTESFALMQRAGLTAAQAILAQVADVRTAGAVVYCGGGNNGGDGWIVAGELARAGCPVGVVEAVPPSTDDATRARQEARVTLGGASEPTRPAVVVDALLGNGATGALREPLLPHVHA